MAVKISEKRVIAGLVLFIAALALFLKIKLVNGPLLVSEKGLALALLAMVLCILSFRMIRRGIHKA